MKNTILKYYYMYDVKMKYVDLFNEDTLNFTCERFNINKRGYKFENITMNNFILNDLEVSNEDITLIKIIYTTIL